jgi:TctA family transporter
VRIETQGLAVFGDGGVLVARSQSLAIEQAQVEVSIRRVWMGRHKLLKYAHTFVRLTVLGVSQGARDL